jgi:DNA-binding IclR family transcriptional regulator
VPHSPSAAPGTARTRLNREALITATEPPRGAQAILRALSVLQAFSADRAWMSATEVAEVTGLSSATTHRILKTLQSQAYLEQDSHTRAYSLGIGILKLASLIAERHDEVALLAGALTRIRELTGETVSLHRRVGDRRICIAEEVSRQPVKVSAGIGNSFPLNGGAASKAIMSMLPDDEIRRILARPREDPDLKPPPREVFLREVAETRERGYATSRGETVPGATGVAVPIRRADPLTPGAIDLAGPSDRMTPELIELALPEMRAAAQQILEVSAPFGART